MEMTKEKRETHTLAKDRYQEIIDFEGSERILMEDDKLFSIGENDDQWISDDAKARSSSGRSFLTIMRSNQFTDHIKNQQRQNKPSIKISPTDEGAQEKAATLRQGLIRHIQYESKAQQARQNGFDDAVDEGRGHWIVKTEHVEGTFNSKIVIEPIPDARNVYMDWRRERPDYSDCKYGFVMGHLSRTEFEEKWPDANLSDWDGERDDFWYTVDDVVIAQYFVEMYKTRVLIEVKGLDDENKESTRILYEDELDEGTDVESLNVLQHREVEDPYWMWIKMTGEEILEEEELPWKEIPIITVIGKENTVNGQWSCKGLIRDIKQPLRLYNFLSSNEADIIAKAPRAPWVGAEGQFETYEEDYANSNTSDVATLEYKMVSLNGQMAPPPQRAQLSVDLTNILQAKQGCIEDIKAITGIYDASIGQRSNETSGVAIRAREAQGNNANFHYIDNYAMAINHEGRVINGALNIIYDMARTITIMGENDEESLKAISPEGEEGEGLGTGNFNTTVSVGPSFNTQREEQAAGMLELAGQSDMIQQVAMDEVVRAQDWNGKEALANRLKAFIDITQPGLTEAAEGGDDDDPMVILQQKFMQLQQQTQELMQKLQQTEEALQKAQADKQAAAVGKIEVDKAGIELDVRKLELETQKVEGEMEIKRAELELKGKEIKADTLKNDLDNDTKLQITDKQLANARIINEAKEEEKEEKEESREKEPVG